MTTHRNRKTATRTKNLSARRASLPNRTNAGAGTSASNRNRRSPRNPESDRSERTSHSGKNGRRSTSLINRTAEGVKDVGSKAVSSVRQHPVSAAMMGAGVVGLALMAVVAAASEPHVGGNRRGRSGKADEGSMMGRARDLFGTLRESASSIGESVEEGYEYSRDTIGIVWENHPLAVGTGILALGIAAGMLLPTTRLENSLLGGAAGKLTDRIATAGRKLIDQGTEFAGRVASETGSAIRGEAERAGLTPQKLARKIKRVTGKVKTVIGEATGV